MALPQVIVNGKVRVLGCKPGPLAHARLAAYERTHLYLPDEFTLEKLATVLDQGQHSTCTANSRAAMRVNAMRAATLATHDGATLAGSLALMQEVPAIPLADPSRLFLYWNTTDSEGDPGEDNGASVTDTAAADHDHGNCHESLWAYTDDNLPIKPTDGCYTQAR